jgi:hypothetical protein
MKKVISLILAVLCMTLAALPFSVSAEAKTVYADDIEMAVMPGKTGSNASSSNEISSEGLKINQAMKFPAVLYNGMSNWNVETLTDYSITMKMKTTVPTTGYWLMLGFGKGNLTSIDSTANFAAIKNRIGICVRDAQLAIKNWNDATEVVYNSANDDALADSIRGGSEVTYVLEVKSSVLAKITISNGIVSQSYELDYNGTADDKSVVNRISVTPDYFGYAWGYAWNDNTSTGSSAKYINSVVSSLYVEGNGNTTYSLDYADLAECSTATVRGGQLSDDGKMFRVVSDIALSEEDLSGYSEHGFEISLKGSTKGAQILKSSTVYTSISAAGDPVTATKGYLGVMTVTGLTAGTDYTFVVRAFVVDAAGNKYFSEAVEISTANA